MKIDLPFTEAMAIATVTTPLPAVVRSMRCEGSTVHIDVDLQAIPDPSMALRLAAAVAGTVAATARFAGYSDGVMTLAITAHARNLPAHKLLPYLLEPINRAISERGLPEGLVEIQRGDPDPLVLVDVQKAVETKVRGITVTGLDIRDAIVGFEARIDTVHLKP